MRYCILRVSRQPGIFLWWYLRLKDIQIYNTFHYPTTNKQVWHEALPFCHLSCPTLKPPRGSLHVCTHSPSKDALAVKVTLNGFPQFLPELRKWAPNPSPGTSAVIDSFFLGGCFVGEIHQGHRCASWAVSNWPSARRGQRGQQCQWQTGRVGPTHSVREGRGKGTS